MLLNDSIPFLQKSGNEEEAHSVFQKKKSCSQTVGKLMHAYKHSWIALLLLAVPENWVHLFIQY